MGVEAVNASGTIDVHHPRERERLDGELPSSLRVSQLPTPNLSVSIGSWDLGVGGRPAAFFSGLLQTETTYWLLRALQ